MNKVLFCMFHLWQDFWCTRHSVLNNCNITRVKDEEIGASLVAQWLGICLLMQGTRVRALAWEDPTCRGTTRPVSHNY